MIMKFLNFSFLTVLVCGLSAGTGAQASAFSETDIMEVMQNTGCDWADAEASLVVQRSISSTPSTVEQHGYSENTLLQTMADQGVSDYGAAAAFLDDQARETAKSTLTVDPYTHSLVAVATAAFLSRRQETSETPVPDDSASLDLIRRLQEEERLTEKKRQEAASREYILRLKEEDAEERFPAEPITTYVAPTSHLSSDHKAKLGTLFASAQAFDDGDVHDFNKAWSKGHIAEVQEIFTAYRGTLVTHSFADLQAEILAYKDSAAVRAALGQLAGYGGAGYGDAESGVLNTLVILSQNWHLASTAIGLSRQFDFDGSGIAKNSRDFIIHSLLENARTAGGCAPGYAGRFVRDQLILLCVQAGIGS